MSCCVYGFFSEEFGCVNVFSAFECLFYSTEYQGTQRGMIITRFFWKRVLKHAGTRHKNETAEIGLESGNPTLVCRHGRSVRWCVAWESCEFDVDVRQANHKRNVSVPSKTYTETSKSLLRKHSSPILLKRQTPRMQHTLLACTSLFIQHPKITGEWQEDLHS